MIDSAESLATPTRALGRVGSRSLDVNSRRSNPPALRQHGMHAGMVGTMWRPVGGHHPDSGRTHGDPAEVHGHADTLPVARYERSEPETLDPAIGTSPVLFETGKSSFQPPRSRTYPKKVHHQLPAPRGRRLRSLHIWCILQLFCAHLASAQGPELPAQVQAAIAEAVARHMRVQRIPGLSLAVGRAGHVVFARGYGKADLEHDVPVTPTTLFRLQSTQKLLTATAVLRLAELGRLRLDDPVQHDCPAFGVRPWPVTVGDLLTHQGGVRPSDLADLFNREHYPSPAAAVRRFVRDTLAHRPGTRVLYSNAGYTLLACAIEGVTGQPYDSALASLVLRPSGMTATRDDNVYEVMPGHAR